MHVSPELSVADEGKITLSTFEWFDAVMDFLVVTKVIRFNETATNVQKRLLTGPNYIIHTGEIQHF